MSSEKTEIVLRVSGGSNPHSVGGSIAKNVQEGKEVTITAIGAGAVNQAVKALAIAKIFLAQSGVNMLFSVVFGDVDICGELKTTMKFLVVKG